MSLTPEQSPKKVPALIISLILAEATSILIAVAMAYLPSISGSDNTLAHYLFEQPNFIQIALVYYLLVNVLLSILAIVFYAWYKSKSMN